MNGNGRRGDGARPPAISCREAAVRVYEYLDGELDPEMAARVHEHIRVCQRCWPAFNFERLFLDLVRGKGGRPEPSRALRERLRRALEQMD